MRLSQISLLFFLTLTVGSVAQDEQFEYRKIENLKSKFIEPNLQFHDILDYLPANYVKDGSEDYTMFIQKAIDNHRNLKFPDFPLMINHKGIKLRSDSHLFFDKNSKLIMKPNKKKKYYMLRLTSLNNVKIYNPTLIGDRNKHLSKDGEHGFGIRINGSKNTTIYNANITNTWGDGIYIGRYKSNPSSDILIKNGKIDNIRRNGISIISGQNITLDSLVISNTNGTNPASAIDLEPNYNTDELKNININNIFTYNNEKDAIIFSFSSLANSTENKKLSINVINHKDERSRYALRFSKAGINEKSNNLSGKINIKNSIWKDSQRNSVILLPEIGEILPIVTFKEIKVKGRYKKDFKNYFRNILQKYDNFYLLK